MAESRLSITIDSRSAEQQARDLQRSLKALEDAGVRVTSSTADIGEVSERSARRMGGLKTGAADASRQLNLMRTAALGVTTAVGSIVGSTGVQQLVRVTDQYKNLTGQLAVVEGSAQGASQAFAALYEVSNNTRSSLESSVTLYARLKQGTSELGLSQQDLLDVVSAVNNSFLVSGASAQEASNATVQLAQAMASGTLRGDELNSILEQAPRLAQAVADSMGITIGALRDMGAEGEITSEVLVNALQGSMIELQNEADRMEVTVGQAMTQLGNDVSVAFGDTDVSPLIDAIDELREIVTDPAFQEAVVTLAAGFASLAGDAARDMGSLVDAISGISTRVKVAANDLLGMGDSLDVGVAKANSLKSELEGLQELQGDNYFNRLARGYGRASVLTGEIAQKTDEYNSALQSNIDTFSSYSSLVISGTEDHVQRLTEQQKVEAKVTEQRQVQIAVAREQRDAERESTKAARENQRQIEQQQKVVQSLYGDVSETGAAWGEYHERLEAINDTTSYMINPQLEMSAAIMANASALNDALRAADPYYKRIEELARQYGESTDESRQLERAASDLHDQFTKGDITAEQYATRLGNVQDEQAELALQADESAQAMANAWEEAGERINETFADAFTGAFESFDDFGDQLLDGFKRLLGELAYQATLKPIVVGFTSQAQSFLGGSQGGSSGGMGGIGDLSSLGKTVYNGITDGFGSINWTGASNAGAGGLYSNASTSAGGLYNNAATGGLQSSSGFLGGSTSNFSGLNGLASMGAGTAGSYVGTELGSSLFGKQPGSNYGAMAGSAIGTYFGGPIGAFAGGSIGGMLDSAFGSGREASVSIASGSKDDDWYGDINRTSAFGTFGITDKSVVGGDDLADTLVALQAYENQLASIMSGEQIEAITDRLEGWSYKGDNISAVFEKRYDQLVDGVKSVADKPLKLMLEKVAEIDDWDFEARDAAFTAALQLDSIMSALGENVSDYIYEKIENVSGSDFSARAEQVAADVNKFLAVQSAADSLSLNFDDLSDGAVYAGRNLVDAAGGMETFNASLSGYYQNFYDEAERTQRATEQLNDVIGEFGLSADSTREEFRGVIESLNLNSSSGREAYLTLMNVQQAFADLVPATEDVSAAVKEAISTMMSASERADAKATYVDIFGPIEFQIATVRDELEAAIGSFAELPTTVEEVRAERNRLSSEQAWQERAVYESNSGLIKQYINLLAEQEEQLRTTGDALNQYGMTQEEVGASKGTYIDTLAPLDFQIAYYRDQLQDALEGIVDELPTSLEEAVAQRNQLATDKQWDERGLYQANSDLISKYIGLLDQQTAAIDEANAAEAARIEQLASSQLQLEIELQAALGNTTAATNMSRQQELSSMDSSLHALQERIWSLQDEAAAQQAASEITRQRTQLEIDLAQAQGDSAKATQMQRDQILASTDDSLDALQQQVWAAQDQAEALKETARAQDEWLSKLEQAQSTLNSFGNTIQQWIDDLNGTDAGLGTPGDQLAATSAAYHEQLALAQSGDQDAMSSITQYANRYLEAQKAYSASGGQTTSLIDRLESELGALPEMLKPTDLMNDPVAQAISEQTDALIDVIDANGDGTISQLELQRAQNEGLLGYSAATVGFGEKQAEQLADAKHDIFEIRQWLTGAGREYNDYGGMSFLERFYASGMQTNVNVDGSHADGLGYVPFDNYVANLHKGEMVMTARDSEALRSFTSSEVSIPRVNSSSSNTELVTELRALRSEVAQMRAERVRNDANAARQRAESIDVQESTTRALKSKVSA